MRYSIDTSSLIEAWQRYPPDVLPRLWDTHFPDLILNGGLRATKEVKLELEKQQDELLEWTQIYEEHLFLEVDGPVQIAVQKILGSHTGLVSTTSAKAGGADPFVIALGLTNACAVVSEENRGGNPQKPRIPDVCAAYKVPCMKALGLIRGEGWVFE